MGGSRCYAPFRVWYGRQSERLEGGSRLCERSVRRELSESRQEMANGQKKMREGDGTFALMDAPADPKSLTNRKLVDLHGMYVEKLVYK